MLIKIARSITPPIFWNILKKISQRPDPIHYQTVHTGHNVDLMHVGRFGNIRDKYVILNPDSDRNATRLRQYLLCLFATIVKNLPGDFVTAGISYGIAPRVIYDFIDFEKLGKTYHFIDPFEGVDETGALCAAYNLDPDFVLNQYPANAPVLLHKGFIPECLESLKLGNLAFVHLNTGCSKPEADSLAYFYDRLSPGGILVIDYYGYGTGKRHVYDPSIKSLGAEVFSMVTGQGVIVKPSLT